uniref:Genome polyprotein n=1 Tax=Thrips tabaci associated jingmen-like virus 1 TaxID=2771481 RepID=A0A7H1D358_9FLAV|nr:putative NS3-like protein [Thrips tabaci associated jingmen-like virus 1]
MDGNPAMGYLLTIEGSPYVDYSQTTNLRGRVTATVPVFKSFLLMLILGCSLETAPMTLPWALMFFVVVGFLIPNLEVRDLAKVKVFGSLLVALRAPLALPLLVTAILLRKTGSRFRLPALFDILFDMAYDKVTSPEGTCIIGVNSRDTIEFFKTVGDGLWANFSEWISSVTVSNVVTASYLRELELPPVTVKVGEAPHLSAVEAHSMFISGRVRNYFFMSLAIFLFLIFFIFAPTFAFAIAMCLFAIRENAMKGYQEAVASKVDLKSGIYYLRTYFLGWVIDESIGVCVNGVMHATHHATYDATLVVGNRWLKPSYISPEADITVWGGNSAVVLATPQDDKFYLDVNNFDSRTTYEVMVDRDEDGNLSWKGITTPGQSGSPLYVIRDGQQFLVGLAGRWVSVGGKTTEYAKSVKAQPVTTPVIPNEVQYYTQHPGYGKTRKIIPKLVDEGLKRSGMVIVSGPTRTVCEEIASALRSIYGVKVSQDTSDSKARFTAARIHVMAHETLLSRIARGEDAILRAGTIILDEVHFNDASTIALQHITREWAQTGTVVVSWLSATIGEEFDRRSNFHITDTQIDKADQLDTVLTCLNNKQKVIWFVKSVVGKDGVDAMHSAVTLAARDIEPPPRIIKLHRATYASLKDILAAKDYDLVISTNIAECGVNLDVDAVVDCSESFDFYHISNDIVGMVKTISLASSIQRRGRCGRSREGTYYYVHTPDLGDREETAAQFDGKCFASAFAAVEDAKLNLTPAQVRSCLLKGYGAHVGNLIFNRYGRVIDKADVQDAVDSFVDPRRKAARVACPASKKDCVCVTQWTEWFDDRVHDDLVAMIREGRRFGRIALK